MLHNVAMAPEGADRHAAANDFTQTGQIRRDAHETLHTAGTKPKAGHDFVKDQDRTVARTQFAHALEVTRYRRDAVHVACYGFGNHAGHLITELVHRHFQRRQVVKGQRDGVLRQHCGHPG